MRQAEDSVYAALLERLHLHTSTEKDIDLLQSRIDKSFSSSVVALVIVRRNILRNAINDHKLRFMSEMTKTSVTYCVADVMKRSEMSMPEIRKIKSENNDAINDEILNLLFKILLMINKNINQNLNMLFYIYK